MRDWHEMYQISYTYYADETLASLLIDSISDVTDNIACDGV